MVDFFLSMIFGLALGFVTGWCVFYIRKHKTETSYILSLIQEDVSNLHIKFTHLLDSLKPTN